MESIIQDRKQKMKSFGVNSQSSLNLNLKVLEISQLMIKTPYRRLYNVLVQSQQLLMDVFRKNLIKEMYFLLLITPVISLQLQDIYLAHVEKLYEAHDHKKIALTSNKLLNLFKNYQGNPKNTDNQHIRPQTGAIWNKQVNSFLRPYTALKNDKVQKLKNRQSKIGEMSTQIGSMQNLTIKQFHRLSTNDEQLLSLDFIHKHRTIHSEFQPFHKQLYSIISTLEENKLSKYETQQQQYQRIDLVHPSDLKYLQKNTKQNQDKMYQISNNQDQNEQNINEEEDNYQEQSQKEEQEIERIEKDRIINKNYENGIRNYHKNIPIEGYQFFKTHTKQQYHRLRKITNYGHLMDKRITHTWKEDEFMVRKYIDYARMKSIMRKENNRKIESKRMFSAGYVNTKSIKRQQLENNTNQFKDTKKTNIIPTNIYTDKPITPIYNKLQVLEPIYKNKLKRYFKNHKGKENNGLKNCQSMSYLKNKQHYNKHAQKFDVLSKVNVQNYNGQVLNEIQKIKRKINCYKKSQLSSKTLMKVLYIDNNENKDQVDWTKKNIFYGMISNGQKNKIKKLRKKGRIIKKIK